MPIELICSCSRSFRLKDELAGRRVRCPGCSAVLVVPQPERDAEEEALGLLLADDPAEERTPVRERVQEEPPRPRSTPPPRPLVRDPLPAADRKALRTKHSSEPRTPKVVFEEGWFGSLNAGVVGGFLMVVIAVVWFVLGLMGGIIFFYPPILLIIGLGAMIKGFTGGNQAP